MRFTGFLILVSMLLSCAGRRAGSGGDGRLELQFIHVNDVYEIAPLAGGREGGIARLATLKAQYLQQNPNTFLTMGGDFLSPSVYFSLRQDGQPIRGRQMVAALNAAGLDFAVFGNHEFDIRESDLQQRLDESRFEWISSNVFQKKDASVAPFSRTVEGKPLPLPRYRILQLKDADGTEARVGLISATLPFNRAEYVHYEEMIPAAQQLFDMLKDSVDAVVAITHQSEAEDIQLAKALPGLALIMGGHEHDMRFLKEGRIHIIKAHANARSAFAVRMVIDKRKGRTDVFPELVMVDERIPFDKTTDSVVQFWKSFAEKNFSAQGFDAARIIATGLQPLDGREAQVRSQSTNLTGLIADAVKHFSPEAAVVLVNSGSIRVDDVLQMPLTEYDILRTLPFGGGIQQGRFRGDLLLQVLEAGRRNRGSGGFLIYNRELEYSGGLWLLKGRPLDPAAVYPVAIGDFLMTGRESGLSFLTPAHPGVAALEPLPKGQHALADIRFAVIRYIRALEGGASGQ